MKSLRHLDISSCSTENIHNDPSPRSTKQRRPGASIKGGLPPKLQRSSPMSTSARRLELSLNDAVSGPEIAAAAAPPVQPRIRRRSSVSMSENLRIDPPKTLRAGTIRSSSVRSGLGIDQPPVANLARSPQSQGLDVRRKSSRRLDQMPPLHPHRNSLNKPTTIEEEGIVEPRPPETQLSEKQRRIARRKCFPRAAMWDWKESSTAASTTMEILIPSGDQKMAKDHTDNLAFRHRQRELGLDAFAAYDRKKSAARKGAKVLRRTTNHVAFMRTLNKLHKKAMHVRNRFEKRAAIPIAGESSSNNDDTTRPSHDAEEPEEPEENELFVTKREVVAPIHLDPDDEGTATDQAPEEEAMDAMFFGETARKKFFQLNREQCVQYEREMKNADRIALLEQEKDPRKSYLTKCRELDLLPEPMQIIRKSKTTHMALQHYYIGDTRAEAIAEGIRRMPKDILSSINMSSNRLTWKGLKCVLQAMQQGAPIVDINMASNLIGPRGATLIGAAIGTFIKLRVLNLTCNNIGDMGIEDLCRGLIENHSVEELYLRDNGISSYGAEKIAQVLCSTTIISTLDLSWNRIRGKGAYSIAVALDENPSLVHLDLSWNSFGESMDNQTMRRIAEAVSSSFLLATLLLSHNKIDKAAIALLIVAMKESRSLCCLHLDNNDTGATEALESNHIQGSRDGHSWIFSRIMKAPGMTQQRWIECRHCYRCESWRPVQFIYRPLVSGPMGHSVKLLIWSTLMEKVRYELSWDDNVVENKIVFSTTIYVPQTEILYSFQVDGLSLWAADLPATLNLAKESLRRNVQSLWKRFDDADFAQFVGPSDLSRVNILPSCLLSSSATGRVEQPKKGIFDAFQGPSVYLASHLKSDFESADLLRLDIVRNEACLEKLQLVVQEHYAVLHEIYRHILSVHCPLDHVFVFSIQTWLNALTSFDMFQHQISNQQAEDIFYNATGATNEHLSFALFINACVQLSKALEEEDDDVEIDQTFRSFLEHSLFQVAPRDLPASVRGILHSEQVEAMYCAHLPALTEVFDRYCVFERGTRVLKLEQFQSILNEAEILSDDDFIHPHDARFVFASSLDQSVHSICATSSMIREEFLEAMGRMALLYSDRVIAAEFKDRREPFRTTKKKQQQRDGRGIVVVGPWLGYNRAVNLNAEDRILPIFDLIAHLRNTIRTTDSHDRSAIQCWKDRLAKAYLRNEAKLMVIQSKRRASMEFSPLKVVTS